MIARADIVAQARTWLGTPFHHQGRVKHVGVDCAGLILGVARELDLPGADMTSYGRQPDSLELLWHCQAEMREVYIDQAQAGDVLLLAIDGRPQHLGFQTEVYGQPGIIHAYAPARRVVEHRIDTQWQQRIRAAFSLQGIA